MRPLPTAALAALFLLPFAACDRAGEEITLTIHADSMIAIQRDTAPDGTVTANCAFTLQGTVEGPEGHYAVVRGGRVRYAWWENNTPGPEYEWTRDAADAFWNDSIISAGATRLSNAHGFGQSEPARLVRGTVTFDYATSTDDETRTTNEWNFYCH